MGSSFQSLIEIGTMGEADKKTLLERLECGEVIIGDGSYIVTLERRGYATAGVWTPESAAEHPEAVEQLGIEFARAGADVTQTFSFWCHEDKLPAGCQFSVDEINQAACDIANRVSDKKGTIVAAGVTQTGLFQGDGPQPSKERVQDDLRSALEIYKKNNIDLVICEYFRNITEMEWAIEVALEFGLPVAATMCIGPMGDEGGVSVGDCAIRMASAGAHIVGVNCLFDPDTTLITMKKMKEALENSGLNPYLMAQPNGYLSPDGGSSGWLEIDEFPYAVEPRHITRWEARKWARQAYDLGIRYIGGCCGFESYHIRAMAEELMEVRGKLPEASAKSDHDLAIHKELGSKMPRYQSKGDVDYWMNMKPATGRPLSTPFSKHQESSPKMLSQVNWWKRKQNFYSDMKCHR